MKRYAWKAVKVTFESSRGFIWPLKGVTKSAGVIGVVPPTWTCLGDPCPQVEGDGLCLALSPKGMASGGYGLLSSIVLLVSFDSKDVLGEDDDKVRVKKCKTHGVVDARSIFINPGANLSGANLYGANLYGANLRRADLSGANLYGANLRRANLRRADLYGANLSRANLYGADLYGANLSGANLYRANLYRADLYGANLSGANLYGANLYGADLYGADLRRANLRRADLSGANLSGANLSGANLPTGFVVPESAIR